MSDIKAAWRVGIDVLCPQCDEVVDLTDAEDFWCDRPLNLAEHGTTRTIDMEVVCPECGHEFEVDLEW